MQVAAYSEVDNRRFKADLPIVDNEVAAGDAESIKLVVRLRSQVGTSAAILEYLEALPGKSSVPIRLRTFRPSHQA